MEQSIIDVIKYEQLVHTLRLHHYPWPRPKGQVVEMGEPAPHSYVSWLEILVHVGFSLRGTFLLSTESFTCCDVTHVQMKWAHDMVLTSMREIFACFEGGSSEVKRERRALVAQTDNNIEASGQMVWMRCLNLDITLKDVIVLSRMFSYFY